MSPARVFIPRVFIQRNIIRRLPPDYAIGAQIELVASVQNTGALIAEYPGFDNKRAIDLTHFGRSSADQVDMGAILDPLTADKRRFGHGETGDNIASPAAL